MLFRLHTHVSSPHRRSPRFVPVTYIIRRPSTREIIKLHSISSVIDCLNTIFDMQNQLTTGIIIKKNKHTRLLHHVKNHTRTKNKCMKMCIKNFIFMWTYFFNWMYTILFVYIYNYMSIYICVYIHLYK